MLDHRPATTKLLSYLPEPKPKIGLVLGSGLGAIAESLTNPITIAYTELPGFPQPSVEGHVGRLLIGDLNGVSMICMQGRMHYYEGHTPASLAIPIRSLQAAGCDTLILTNAAGSLNQAMPPGSLMMISDHINWAGVNPLIGPNDTTIGPRFFDMTNAYDAKLRRLLAQAADAIQLEIHEGVYLMCSGPNFETPAEIQAFHRLGANAVGMSTVPECLVANHCGMRVVGISIITNLAAGLSNNLSNNQLNHEETLAEGTAAANKLNQLLSTFLPQLQ